jgi:predicted nuclease of predicted toxin-antitoxin system
MPDAVAVRDLSFKSAEDRVIFDAARKADAVVVTKDRDLVDLLERYGPPPKVVWVTLRQHLECADEKRAREGICERVRTPQWW